MKTLFLLLCCVPLVADDINTVIIVPAALRDAANQASKMAFDASGGEGTFTQALTVIGQTNATHYWCAARFSDTNRALLSQMVATPPFTSVIVADYNPDTDPAAPARMLATNGLAPFALTNAP
jgi:phage tail sheath gpL-like